MSLKKKIAIKSLDEDDVMTKKKVAFTKNKKVLKNEQLTEDNKKAQKQQET